MRELLESLQQHPRIGSQVAFRAFTPPAGARFADTAGPLAPTLADALRSRGIERLWCHQARAVDAVGRGRSTMVVTPTASGKSLVFQIPTLQAFLADPDAAALYLFPFKALARDQLGSLRELAQDAAPLRGFRAAVYDGDTPDGDRRKVRKEPPHVLLTNPDMLHLGILPHHHEWASFLSRLRLVVLDEAHVYRGIFGTHVHHVLQRLRRVAALHGADPTFVACSATIGDPGGFAESLVGVPFEVIDDSGAPRGGRHLLDVNPIGASPYTLGVELFAALVEAGRKTIVFTKARRITELMHFWLSRSHPALARRTAAYRAGYLPEERRDIEKRLFSGELDGVITTSALEHGIDVGGLDACVLVGYPGSIASTWQRMGRSGRGADESLAVLVAMPDALDQYVVAHPSMITDGQAEPVVFDPDNESIAGSHLVCAGAESPLVGDELRGFSTARPQRVEDLTRDGRLVRDHEEERWYSLRRRPHRDLNLRSAGTPYTIVDARSDRTVGSLDAGRAFQEGHEGAIYLHAGVTYLVQDLDLDARKVVVEPARVDYFTTPYGEKETRVLETTDEREIGPFRASLGRLEVTVRILEYGRRRMNDQVETARHPLDLPPVTYETTGFWLTLPGALDPMLRGRERHFLGSLHAAEHTAIGLFPLLALCDRGDIGGISYAFNPQLEAPAIFVYDGHPGGVGLARAGYGRLEELLETTRSRLESCPCDDGCPGCVQSPRCGSGNRPLDKLGALLLLDVLTGRVPLEAASDEAIRSARDASLETHRANPHRGIHGKPVRPAGVPAAGPAPAAAVAAHASTSPFEGRATEAGLDAEPGGAEMAEVRSSLSASEGRIVFFDLETRRSAEEVGGWDRIEAMGLALACVYDPREDRHRTYLEADADRLLVDLLTADQVVGFNVDRFDLRVLAPYARAGLGRVRTLDMLARIRDRVGFRLSLGHLATETLGVPKSADGLQSLEWFREGRVDDVARYCRKDVELTARLFAYGRTHRYLVYRDHGDRRVRLPVDW